MITEILIKGKMHHKILLIVTVFTISLFVGCYISVQNPTD